MPAPTPKREAALLDEDPASTLTWLHLSDLHCCALKTGWDAARVLRALRKDLEDLRRDHDLAPDLLLFTGDAAFGQLPKSPIAKQFQEAKSFFEGIQELCSLPSERVFLVPGNHDVHRQKILKSTRAWLAGLAKEDVVELIRDADDDWRAAMRGLADYHGFLEDAGYTHLLADPERLVYTCRLDVNGVVVGVAGLNSAWSCSGAEKGALWLGGEWQLATAESALEGADVRIGLIHHPLRWFRAGEAEEELELAFKRIFDFHLHGHEHKPWVHPLDGGTVRIAAGACYDRKRKEQQAGYNLVRLDFRTRRGEVWLRQYQEETAAWIPNHLHGETSTEGVWSLHDLRCFPAEPAESDKAGRGGPPPPKPEAPQPGASKRRSAPPPRPHYPDETTRELARSLEQAYRSRALLLADGEDTTDVNETILDLRRKIREGGQLKEGDFLLDGRFQLLEMVGRGGFAQVWRAYDQSGHDVVAIKVLHGQHTRDLSRRERFFRGARHMARLQHPGIVRVIEEEREDGGYFFFVMEYVGGGDLRQAVKAGRLSPEERLKIIREVGEVLTFAHERGVIHRDVKPGNVLLDKENRPKLTDFDLVRAADTTGGTRTTGLGTFLYAAPEAMMDAKTAAEPADVYGLGVTAVFALHGADLPPDAFWELPQFVAKLEVSEGCRSALQRAVARKVKDRWASVVEFCEALSEGEGPPAELEASLEDLTPAASSQGEGRPTGGSKTRPKKRRSKELFRTVETTHDGRVELWREIPAGEGWIGSPESEEGRHDDEGPRHQVTIVRPFEMAAVPVTNAQYAGFDPAHADAERPDHPVGNVTWDKAVSYCRWLAVQVPACAGVRLPTEEEWEYACRAGTETRYWSGDSEEALAEVGWYRGNSNNRLHRVGKKRANPWGLYDMHGNVWEWTLSPWRSDYSAHESGRTVDPAAISAALPADLAGDAAATPGGWRVFRGGGSWVTATGARSAYRDRWDPGNRRQNLGFRLVRSVRRPGP